MELQVCGFTICGEIATLLSTNSSDLCFQSLCLQVGVLYRFSSRDYCETWGVCVCVWQVNPCSFPVPFSYEHWLFFPEKHLFISFAHFFFIFLTNFLLLSIWIWTLFFLLAVVFEGMLMWSDLHLRKLSLAEGSREWAETGETGDENTKKSIIHVKSSMRHAKGLHLKWKERNWFLR